jgi:hypothetical protein
MIRKDGDEGLGMYALEVGKVLAAGFAVFGFLRLLWGLSGLRFEQRGDEVKFVYGGQGHVSFKAMAVTIVGFAVSFLCQAELFMLNNSPLEAIPIKAVYFRDGRYTGETDLRGCKFPIEFMDFRKPKVGTTVKARFYRPNGTFRVYHWEQE